MRWSRETLLVSSITMLCVFILFEKYVHLHVCFFLSTVRELPPIYPDVRQKQRISIDVLPPEVKARFVSDPIIPIRTKTAREFQYGLSVYYAFFIMAVLILLRTCLHLTTLNSVYLFKSRDDVEKATISGDWKHVHDFYMTTFESFLELNAAFKVCLFLFSFYSPSCLFMNFARLMSD